MVLAIYAGPNGQIINLVDFQERSKRKVKKKVKKKRLNVDPLTTSHIIKKTRYSWYFLIGLQKTFFSGLSINCLTLSHQIEVKKM
jgi:hypothetical protein